jgi:hypothetical protein
MTTSHDTGKFNIDSFWNAGRPTRRDRRDRQRTRFRWVRF